MPAASRDCCSDTSVSSSSTDTGAVHTTSPVAFRVMRTRASHDRSALCNSPLTTKSACGADTRIFSILASPSARPVDTAMAYNVTTRLADGLARIENIRVSAPQADFVVSGELHKAERSWEARVRMTRKATGDVVWTAPVSVELEDTDLSLQQSRLAAGIGHPLALRIGALLDADAHPAAASRGSPPGSNNVVIEQATASILQISRERFATAQTMLEKAHAGDPDNVELAVALAALQLRGIQMVWYSAAESATASSTVRSILE